MNRLNRRSVLGGIGAASAVGLLAHPLPARAQAQSGGTSFTVIRPVRMQLGDREVTVSGEQGSPFVGAQWQTPFDCVGVDSGQDSVLMLQVIGADLDGEILINGQVVYGGLPRNSGPVGWNANVLPVGPGILQAENNVLWIGAALEGTNADDLVVDNIVLFYKTQ